MKIDSSTEEWTQCRIGENQYTVSSYGRIKKDGMLLKPQKSGTGTLQLQIGDTTHQLGRLVYFSFNKDELYFTRDIIMHEDGIKHNNRLVNLKRVTQSQFREIRFAKDNPSARKAKRHLKTMREIAHKNLKMRTSKVCSVCDKEQDVKNFPKGRRQCRSCINTMDRNKRKNKRND